MHLNRFLRICAAASLLVVPAAWAQTSRTFVSSSGSDTNPCSRVTPCRSFQAAMELVDPGGEVIALDTAGYGPVTITKSVSLIAPAGTYAGITSTSTGITINAPQATVILRGLELKGVDTWAINGIVAPSVGKLIIENCTISGFSLFGLGFGGSGELFVTDTVIRGSQNGFSVQGTARATFRRCRAEETSANGFVITTGASALLQDCVSARNGSGVAVSAADVVIKSSFLVNNAYGISAGNGAVVYASDCMIAGNSFGFLNESSTIRSYGNNDLIGNFTDKSGTVSLISRQ